MKYELKIIDAKILSSMKTALSNSAGYTVSIEEELEYFNELPPKGWVAAIDSNNEVVGFVRHFPQGDWAAVELYASPQSSKRGAIAEQLLKKFLDSNTFLSGFRIRIDLSAFDHELNQAVQELGLSEKKETFLHFEMSLTGNKESAAKFDLPKMSDALKITEVFNYLHSLTKAEVESWINYNRVRVVAHQGKIVAAAHLGLHDDSAEIIRIATHGNHLRQGFAKTLLENINTELCRLGIKKLYLKVDETRYPAVALYKKFGFKENKNLAETWHSKWF